MNGWGLSRLCAVSCGVAFTPFLVACSDDASPNPLGDGGGDSATVTGDAQSADSQAKDAATADSADATAATDGAAPGEGGTGADATLEGAPDGGLDGGSSDSGDATTLGDGTVGDANGSDGNLSPDGASGVEGGGGPETGWPDGASGAVATLFVPDDIDQVVYRYNVSQAGGAVYAGSISTPLAYAVAFSADGELFVASYAQVGSISRFLSPQGTPVTNGMISSVGLVLPDVMAFFDGQLWVPGTSAGCNSSNTTLVRIAFDAQGNASVAGTDTTDLTGATRTIAFSAATRDLYVTQCGTTGSVQHFHVASDETLSVLPAVTAAAMYNPAGVVVAPWGEVLVTGEGTESGTIHGNTVFRFLVDGQGNVTANGTIQGNGLDSPFGIAFTPWGELLVSNNSSQSVSRFTFDAFHNVTANGTFTMVTTQDNAIAAGTSSIAVVAGASSGLPTEAGVPGDGG